MGSPQPFSQDAANEICKRLMQGQSLSEVCRDDAMPPRWQVYEWLAENQTFSDSYARAREIGADAIFDEIAQIADDATNDWMKAFGEDSEDGGVGYKLNGEHVQRSKLRIDARKWVLARMSPKRYGEKLDLGVSGPNGGPIETAVTFNLNPVKGRKPDGD